MDIVVVRGGGDLASGVIHKLFKSGYKVVVLEVEEPLSIRRTVSFSQAIYDGEIIIEGVKGVRADSLDEIIRMLKKDCVPVYSDREGHIIEELKPIAVVDAIIAKENLGTNIDMAAITIAIGPGFEAGVDVDLVIESKRGHYLGRVIYEGRAAKNTGIPGDTMGYKEERVIRAPCDGIVKPLYKIGDRMEIGDTICYIGDSPVEAKISGTLRGMIMDGLFVHKGLKIGDIDPRGIDDYVFTISDKARSIAGGVLEGILSLKVERGI